MKKIYLTPTMEMHDINFVSSLMATSMNFGGTASRETIVDVKAGDWGDIWDAEEKE